MSEIVHIVLDVEEIGDDVRVLVQGVFTSTLSIPPQKPGRQRNIVQVFLDADMRDVSAFIIGGASI